MQITDVKTLPYQAAFHDLVFVTVETDEGIHGWGEAGGMGRERACEATVQELKHYFIGQVGSAARAHRPVCRRDVSAHDLRHAVARLRRRRTARCSAAVSAPHLQEGSAPCPTGTH